MKQYPGLCTTNLTSSTKTAKMNKEEKSNKDCINIILEILNGRSVWSSFQILEDAKHQIEIEAVFKENKSKR